MPYNFRFPFVAIFLCILTLTTADALAGQEVEESVFIVHMGGDTLSTEHYTRSADQLEGEIVDRRIGTVRYTATLGPDATVSRIELAVSPPGAPADAPPVQRATITFRGDTVISEMTGGADPEVQRIVSKTGVFPFLNSSFALVEQALMHVRTRGGEGPVELPMFLVMGGQTMPAIITPMGSDSATFALAGTELRAAIGADGRLLGASVPAQNLRVERVGGDAAPPTVPIGGRQR